MESIPVRMVRINSDELTSIDSFVTSYKKNSGDLWNNWKIQLGERYETDEYQLNRRVLLFWHCSLQVLIDDRPTNNSNNSNNNNSNNKKELMDAKICSHRQMTAINNWTRRKNHLDKLQMMKERPGSRPKRLQEDED